MHSKNMRAMAITEYGDSTVIKPLEFAIPNIDDFSLLVHVSYSSTNPVDKLIRTGTISTQKFPAILGFDVCGTVKKIGKNVKGFQVGDLIAACPNLMKDGANAEYVAVDSRTAVKVPTSVVPEIAGVFPLVALTAWESLFDRAKITHSDTILIHAGAGGVGHIALQLAKEVGCRIITTASRPESIALCHDLGADHVINYKKNDFSDEVNDITKGNGCDAIFDFVGEDTFNHSMECINVNGRVVTVKDCRLLSDGNNLLLKNITIHYEFVGTPTIYGINPEQQAKKLDLLFSKITSGTVKPIISKTFPITALSEAHKFHEQGDFFGKISICYDEWL